MFQDFIDARTRGSKSQHFIIVPGYRTHHGVSSDAQIFRLSCNISICGTGTASVFWKTHRRTLLLSVPGFYIYPCAVPLSADLQEQQEEIFVTHHVRRRFFLSKFHFSLRSPGPSHRHAPQADNFVERCSWRIRWGELARSPTSYRLTFEYYSGRYLDSKVSSNHSVIRLTVSTELLSPPIKTTGSWPSLRKHQRRFR